MNSELNNAKKKKLKLGVRFFNEGKEDERNFPPDLKKEHPIFSLEPEYLGVYIKENPDNVLDIKLEEQKQDKER